MRGGTIKRSLGQIMPTARRAAQASMLTASPKLLEPVFLCEMSCPRDAVGACSSVLAQRRGSVFAEEQRPGTPPMMTLKAHLPVAESFGFAEDLRSGTGGRAFPQFVFDHWREVSGDPRSEGSESNAVVRELRRWKGLAEDIPPLDRFLDRL